MKVFFGTGSDRGAWTALLLVGLVVVLWGAQPWLWGYVFDVAASFRDRQTQQAQLANTLRLVEDVRQVDPAAQALLDQAAIAFPTRASAPQIVERLEALADSQTLSLQLESIREEPATNTRRQQLIPLVVNLSVAGSPAALLGFLEKVEHMQELTQVDEWSMKPLPVPPPAKVYRLEMRVRFFLQPSA